MFSMQDLAKYPFTVEAAEYVRGLELKLEDFSSLDYEKVLEKAVERIEKAVSGVTKASLDEDINVEVLSFPLAVLMMKIIGDSYFQKRFTLFESKKTSENLKSEKTEKIIHIAEKNFQWAISEADSKFPGMLKLNFVNYLKNASKLHEDEWKLVNRHLEHGDVYLDKHVAIRLLEEEIRLHILSKIESGPSVEPPEAVAKRIESVKAFLQEHKKRMPLEEPLGEVDVEAYPPCIRSMYLDVSVGKNVPHIGRFALTAFLLNVGMSCQDIVKLYTSATDFNEQVTRYQVEHIAGLSGGRTKYKPLNCVNMQTHRLCVGREGLCLKIRNPLQYYRIRKRKQ